LQVLIPLTSRTASKYHARAAQQNSEYVPLPSSLGGKTQGNLWQTHLETLQFGSGGNGSATWDIGGWRLRRHRRNPVRSFANIDSEPDQTLDDSAVDKD
jgi:hypothetical protein